MTADYFRAAATGGEDGILTQQVAVTNPGCLDGDILFIVLGGYWEGDYTPTSSGWTEVTFADASLLQHTGARLFRKVASSEPASWTFSWPEVGSTNSAWISASYKHGNVVTGAIQGDSATGTFVAYTNTENNAVALNFGAGRWFTGGAGFATVTAVSSGDLRGVAGCEGTYGVSNRRAYYLADEYVASGNFPANQVTWSSPGGVQESGVRLVTAADFALDVPADTVSGGSTYAGRRITARDLPYHVNKSLVKDV